LTLVSVLWVKGLKKKKVKNEKDIFSFFETKTPSYIFLVSRLFITFKSVDESKAMISEAARCFTTRKTLFGCALTLVDKKSFKMFEENYII
jgi:hypothetical protein